MNGNNTYEERNSGVNIGEIKFEAYCDSVGWRWWRLGWDEKNNPVPDFFDLNPHLRNLPDYLIIRPEGKALVNVKGSTSFKKKERENMGLLSRYTTEKCPFFYVFCLPGLLPIFKTREEIARLYADSKDEIWPDGKVYRVLKISSSLT